MLPGLNWNRNLASKLIAGMAIILVMAGSFGCLPAPVDESIDLTLNPGAELCLTIEQLDAVKSEAYQAGQKAGCKADIVLSNLTYAQLQKFLKDNQTLTMCEGNCVDRTIDLSECAIHNGWEMYVVLLNFEEGPTGHVLGAFQTKDKGIIFVESQTLWMVKVEIGYDYALNFTERNWSFPQSTIKQIGILR